MPRPRRDPEELSRLGRVLRTQREDAGVTLADLAAETGVHEKTVSRWELSGVLPPADQLRVLVRVVDSERPRRAKARILEAAGLLDPHEAEILIPYDEASFMFGAIDDAVRETLPSLFEALRRAATATDDELVRDFFDRHERYLAEQKRRLGRRL